MVGTRADECVCVLGCDLAWVVAGCLPALRVLVEALVGPGRLAGVVHVAVRVHGVAAAEDRLQGCGVGRRLTVSLLSGHRFLRASARAVWRRGPPHRRGRSARP